MSSGYVGEGGETVLGYVVKRIKGRLYVYEQYRRDGKVITKYVGPLERIIEEYKRCQNMGNGAKPHSGAAAGIRTPDHPVFSRALSR